MDALADLLDGPRARGAFLLRAVMASPWGLRIEDDAPLTLVAVLRGATVHVPDEGPPVMLAPGDVALVKGPAPYTFGDDPATEPRVRILPDQVCVDPDGQIVDQAMDLGVRRWGNAADGIGDTELLIGTWHGESEVSRPLLAALPACVVRRHGQWDATMVDLLAAETTREDPGQAAVLDRLLDLVLVSVVRSWVADDPSVTRGIAHADPVIGRALRLLHGHPEYPWTLVSLARACDSSRAVFARRFTDLVGEPAIGYLTRWRLALAADLLVGTEYGLVQIASEVGYGSPFALSAAFTRHHGVSPRQYRRRAGRASHAPARASSPEVPDGDDRQGAGCG